MSSTAVETTRKPKYIGPSHDEGGIPAEVVETGEKIEIEGNEMKICNAAYNSPEFHEFKDMTNEEIIHEIHNINSCVFHPQISHGGDWIICKAAINNKTKRNISGTIREILDIIQGEHGCKVSWQESSDTMEKGGPVEVDPEIKERWDKKKEHITTLANNIHRLKAHITKALQSKNEKERLTALAIETMFYTGERVGNDESAANDHRGITGMKKSNVKCEKGVTILSYTGKSGVKHNKIIRGDRLTSHIKKALKKAKGYYLFCTSDGKRITPDMINRFLQKYSLTSKDIRGFVANRWLLHKLENAETPKEDKDRKKLFNKLAKKVAARVGHSTSMLKNSYLAPELEDEYINNGKIIDLKKLYMGGGEVKTERVIGKGCLMLSIHLPDWQKYLSAIKKEDIYNEPGYGLETEPHVTIVYGFDDEKTNVPELIQKVHSYINKPITVHGKSISLFKNDAPYEVVKIDIESALLKLLNGYLMKEYNIKSDFPDYHAHATIAYVKKGKGKKYVKKFAKPITIQGTEIIYSHPDDSYAGTGKKKEVFPLEYNIVTVGGPQTGKTAAMKKAMEGKNAVILTPKKKDKILYLHGYKDVTTKPLVVIMREAGWKVIAPTINYNEHAWHKIHDIVEKEKPDAVVGHSLGGYFAYYISQEFNIPALLLSPALTREWMEKQPISYTVMDIPPHPENKQAIIGWYDNDIYGAKEFLLGKASILQIEQGHQIPPVIFGIYFRTFINNHLLYNNGGSVPEITPKSLPIILKGTPEGDAILRKVSVPVTKDYPGLKQFIADIKKTTVDNVGLGLAAPQVGKNIRLFVTAPLLINPRVLINPELLESKGEWISEESCLSIPGESAKVKRPQEIKVKYLDEDFVEHTETLEGKEAAIFLHELDHLDGVLITDKKFEDGGLIKTELVFTDTDAVKEYCKKNADMYLTECNLKRIVLTDGNIYIFAKQNENGELIYALEESKLNKNLRKLLEVLKTN